MARKFSELRDQMLAKMSPEKRAAYEADAERMVEEHRLQQIRNLRQMSQAQVAEALNVGQGSVSRLESQNDMRVSTLREYIEAIGGKLEMRAVFPESSIPVDLSR